ncbi:hypothetical protein PBP221_06620 [Paraburkholderia sp. 22B1P]|nr:hypothetical protein PPGU16_06720 [Paraburkholderia sp. PGU16]BEU20522.1 hypothetical protein PBP221_06620 [Paraburkholderia sp. 22B1P]
MQTRVSRSTDAFRAARERAGVATRADRRENCFSISVGVDWQSPWFSMSRSQNREVTMSIFAYRKHLRFLTHSQRRRWWDQKKRLTPRVKISGAYVPPNVTREFTYVKVG